MADLRETIIRLFPHIRVSDAENIADVILHALAAAGQTYEDGVRAGMERTIAYLEKTAAARRSHAKAATVKKHSRNLMVRADECHRLAAYFRAAATTTGGDND